MSRRLATRPAMGTHASQTITYDSTSEQSSGSRSRHIGTLRLRGQPKPPRRGVRWADDVVDNSNMGRKKSKVCCIYHKARPIGESSSESSSSSSSGESDSDSEPDMSKARLGGKGAAKKRVGHKDHDCDCNQDLGNESTASDEEGNEITGRENARQQAHTRARSGRPRRRSPNAYEKMKRYKTGGNGTVTVTESKK